MVWKYFKKSKDKKFARCLTCGNNYKTSGNTTNLTDHLKRFHPFITKKAVRDTEGNDSQNECSSICSSSSSGNLSNINMKSVTSYFKKETLYDNSSQRKKDLDMALLTMIATDFQPFSIVNDKGFRMFVELLDPRYKLPSTHTLCEKMLKDAYLVAYTKLKCELNSIKYLAITCDSWTSIATESYLTVTCHYIKDFVLKSAVLSTKPLGGEANHTSENIAQNLRDIFNEWEIDSKIVCIVTDNAANIKKHAHFLKKHICHVMPIP